MSNQGGFPGGLGGLGGGLGGLGDMGNMMDMLKQAQKQAEQMKLKMENQLKEKAVEGSTGGGMVKVTSNGALDIRKVEIDPSLMDPKEKEMLEDLLCAAVNVAVKKAKQPHDQAQQGQISNMMGALGGMGKRSLPVQSAAWDRCIHGWVTGTHRRAAYIPSEDRRSRTCESTRGRHRPPRAGPELRCGGRGDTRIYPHGHDAHRRLRRDDARHPGALGPRRGVCRLGRKERSRRAVAAL